MRYFLLAYDRRSGVMLSEREFPAAERATALRERFALEQRYRDEPGVEVVVLGAPSRDVLERTHARYFKNPHDLAAAAG